MDYKEMICGLALATLAGCADPTGEESESASAEDDSEVGTIESPLIEKVVFRSINAGDPPAVYFGAGRIEVRLEHSSRYGSYLQISNKSGTPVDIPYADHSVKCKNGDGNWTTHRTPGRLNGGQTIGWVQLCFQDLLSTSTEVKIVRP